MSNGQPGSGRRLRVGVIFGGRSGEHEVSLLSASSVMAALDERRFEVVPIAINRAGRWLAGPAALETLRREATLLPTGAMRALAASPAVNGPREAIEIGLLPDPSRRGVVQLSNPSSPSAALGTLDVVFPVLHGPFGEDGTIQGLLELAGLPYVGAGVLGSAVGMDKVAMKDLFRAHALPVMDYLPVSRRAFERDPAGTAADLLAELPLPMFIKPANLGSSVGISKVRGPAELLPALRRASVYDRRLIAEAAAQDAREIECSVLGNDDPKASIPGEIIPSREFYDYHAKYLDEGSELIVPADLPPPVVAEVQSLAVRAFLALDCAGMARVDFFVGRHDGRVIVNELNTIPGFTSISMYPKMWQASGLPYTDLLTKLIDLALERHADRRRSRTSYSPLEEPYGGGRGC